MPKLSMVAYDPAPPRIHGDFAIHAGAYTFAWAGADGKMTETRARFTFAYRRENGKWVMIEHHSSAMPKAPPGLKPVSIRLKREVFELVQGVYFLPLGALLAHLHICFFFTGALPL